MEDNSIRQKNIDIIYKILISNTNNINVKLIESVARQIERSCYNVTIIRCLNENQRRTFNNQTLLNWYSMNVYRVVSNLDPASHINSSYLITQIINYIKYHDSCENHDYIDPKKVGTLTSEQLYPDKIKELKEQLEIRRKQKIIEKTSNLYKCGKCHHDETKFKEVQFRAADEGTSLSITCTRCSHHWVQN